MEISVDLNNIGVSLFELGRYECANKFFAEALATKAYEMLGGDLRGYLWQVEQSIAKARAHLGVPMKSPLFLQANDASYAFVFCHPIRLKHSNGITGSLATNAQTPTAVTMERPYQAAAITYNMALASHMQGLNGIGNEDVIQHAYEMYWKAFSLLIQQVDRHPPTCALFLGILMNNIAQILYARGQYYMSRLYLDELESSHDVVGSFSLTPTAKNHWFVLLLNSFIMREPTVAACA